MRPRVLSTCLAAAALAVAAVPAHAATEQLQPLRPVPLQSTARVFPAPVRDAVMSGPLNRSATIAATARAASARYLTARRHLDPRRRLVRLQGERLRHQSYVTFLGSLTHGPS